MSHRHRSALFYLMFKVGNNRTIRAKHISKPGSYEFGNHFSIYFLLSVQ